MNITKRITKFLLIAALAIPAWTSLSAQKPTAPPEKVATEVDAEKAMIAPIETHATQSQMVSTTTESAFGQISQKALFKGLKKSKNRTKGGPTFNAPNRAGTAVTLPSTATVEEWEITTDFYKANSSSGFSLTDFSSTIKVAFDGNDIYIAGFCDVFPDSWVKGTISGNTVRFASGQYYGTYTYDSTDYEFWFVGENADDEEVDYVEFTYNTSSKQLTLQTAYINNKDAATGGSYYSFHQNTVISKPTSVTIADDTNTNSVVPVYGWYHDISSNTSQMIYPASYLTGIPDKALIKSITFYTNDAGIKFAQSNKGELTATIGTTTQSQFSSTALISISGTTSTATVQPVYGEKSLTFTFNTPFQYTSGTNLIIQTVNTTTGSCDPSSSNSTLWLGVSGSTPYGYNNKKGATQSFMPKMYVEYEDVTVPYEATLTGNGVFGNVQKGETATATFTVTNEGANAFTPVVTATGNGFTVSSTETGSLAAGASRDYTVTFAPTAVKEYTGTLTLSAQESEASAISATAALSGNGINEQTVIVAEGSVQGNLPVYLHYLDAQNHGQIIYPAGSLGLTPNSVIHSITFHSNSALTTTGSNSGNNTVTLKLGETDNASFGSSTTFLTEGLTVVASLTSTEIINGTQMATFTFSTPYEYHGGNLVVDASCPSLSSGKYTSSSVQWVGQTVTGASILYMNYNSGSTVINNVQQNFLPKMTMVVDMAEGAPTTELDFGSVEVDGSKTLPAYIANNSDSEVTATVMVSPNPPFSLTSTSVTLTPNETTPVPVTFSPKAAISYNGTLTVIVGNDTTIIPLKGVGNVTGSPEAIRDKEFFDGITYDWTDSEGSHTSKLSDVATKPEQIIAMLKKVYTDKTIPGNLKRGCDENGYFTEDWSDVSYPAIGKIKYTGTSGNTTQLQNPDYFEWDSSNSTGWGIDTKKDIVCGKNTYTGSSSTYTSYYATFDQTEYRPDNEGVTMLLVEMVDDYDRATYTAPTSTGEQYLKDVVSLTIKSVRIVTEAKRVGEGQSRGTIFNVSCDKMNKFFFLAKGQLRLPFNSKKAGVSSGSTTYYPAADFCPYPLYLYSSNYFGQGELNKFYDYNNSSPFFFQMFEQFSPVNNATGLNIDDLYSNLVKMTSFPVIHDCITIPFAYSTSAQETDIHGHQFMMYGVESGAADCQDVRDLMFFVPDYRMMKWDDGSSNNDGRGSQVSCFHDYNQSHAPTMGLYVIQQDSVQAVTRADDYFKLKLTWDSNMDEFLPDEKQEYQLYEVFTDEFGVSKWIPVYERNAQGLYRNATTGEWQADTTGAKPVVLTVDPSNTKKTYSEVYELRENSGRMVTYAVRGQDVEHFLSLQMSNEESYFIPGKDPAEMALMSSATVYSRYEAQNENNCYSNKIQIKSSPRTIKSSYLTDGNTMTINRSYAKLENGETVTVTEPIATLTINTSGKYFTVTGSVVENQASVKSLFPVGTHDGKTAGYHANNLTNNRISYTTSSYNNTTYINFDINLWDNFVANVSKNDHPGMYTYQLRFNTSTPFQGLNGSTSEAYSNPYRVYVYKTDSKVNEPLTLDQVKGDTGCSDDYKPGDVEFSAQVMLSSKGEILRYDAYRWNEGDARSIIYDGGDTDEDEEDEDPTGMAGNQGATYTVSMNAVGTADYYKGDEVPVTATAPLNWATFVDYYPANLTDGGAFTYAPVVELFTRGYVEGSTTEARGDYNTYGGPLKTTAVGKMELEIPDDLNTAGNPFMSTYKWFDGTNWCAYYKIPVKFHALGIPEGYELYKIRAWRDVDTNILREELSDHQDRIAANYLFEDLTYGDALGDGHTMSKENLYKNVDGTVYSYELGRRAIGDEDPQSEAYTGETHATFGALRINTKDGQPYAIDNLAATIKVRAYFTKKSNPLFSDPIYVIADNGSGWDYDTPLATLICEDGANFTGTVTIPAASDGSGKGYFMFSKQLGSSWSNNPKYIFGAESNGNAVVSEWPNGEGYNLKYWQSGTQVLEVYPGTYQLTIGSHVQDIETSQQWSYQAGYLTITRTTAKASTRAEIPANYGYYVAEGEVEFNSNMFNQIITGVTDVTMNATREVMSVSYVNTIGQVSSTPWKGVNMVVTRYTDGSTSTTKVMK